MTNCNNYYSSWRGTENLLGWFRGSFFFFFFVLNAKSTVTCTSQITLSHNSQRKFSRLWALCHFGVTLMEFCYWDFIYIKHWAEENVKAPSIIPRVAEYFGNRGLGVCRIIPLSEMSTKMLKIILLHDIPIPGSRWLYVAKAPLQK